MKRTVFLMCLMFICLNIQSQTLRDSIESLFAIQSEEIAVLKRGVSNLSQQVDRQASELQAIRSSVTGQSKSIVDLETTAEETKADLKASAKDLDDKISLSAENAKTEASEIKKDVKVKGRLALGGIIILLIGIIGTYFLLKWKILKGDSSLSEIKKAQTALESAQQKLSEDGIKLDEKLLSILDKQMSISANQPTPAAPDHSLALKVADEIVRIETNLSRMDPATRGYKQLSASVRRIKDNFLANGYEIVDMLGKPYVEGMKVIADFLCDESLAEGAQIITGVTKPQINYNGEMIQAARITVSQNI